MATYRHHSQAVVVLAVTLTLGVGAAARAAEFAGGTGEPNDPYQIATGEQLTAIGSDPNLLKAHFVLTADIDLDPNRPGGRVFIESVIAHQSPFAGGFDGGGHALRNLVIAAPEQDGPALGFFGDIERNGRVENLVLENASITGGGIIGTLAGVNSGEIVACLTDGAVAGTGFRVGGLVGSNYGGRITNSRFEGSVSGVKMVGGLVGANRGTIAACYASSDVVGDTHVGGLAGENGITGGDLVWSSSLQNAYASGTVQGQDGVAALVGYDSRYGEVVNCYAAGYVLGVTHVGGLIGQANEGYVRDSFWDIEATSQTTSGAGVGKTTVEMRTRRTFTAWGCSGVWTLDDGAGYPRLSWEKQAGQPVAKAAYGGGSGTEADPYQIYTAEQLNEIGQTRCDWDKHFKLMADIDLAELGETSFHLIGSYVRYKDRHTIAFTGVLDGNHRTISNFRYTSESADHVGLISYMAGDGCIRDLWLRDPNVTISGGRQASSLVGLMAAGVVTNCHVQGGRVSGDEEVGGLIGRVEGGEEEASVSGCSFEGTVVGRLTVGGLVGVGGALADCSVRAQVSGEYQVGGLVGVNYSRALARCRSEGRVSGGRNVAGLAGENFIDACIADSNSSAEVYGDTMAGGLVGSNWGTIARCGAEGAVTGIDYLAGLVAYNGGTAQECCATGKVEGDESLGGLVASHCGAVSDCYATGAVSGRQGVGGLLPYSGGSVLRCYATGNVTGEEYVGGLMASGYPGGDCRDSFWDVQTTGVSQSAAGVGLTTVEMRMAEPFVRAGWDFNEVWMICAGKDYPRLRWEQVECDE